MKYQMLKESIVNEMAKDDNFRFEDFFSIRRRTPEEAIEENPGHDVCPNCGAVDDWEYANGKKYCYQCEWQDPDYHEGPSDEEQVEKDLNSLSQEEGEERECGRCGKPYRYNPYNPSIPYSESEKEGGLCPECSMEQMAQDYGQNDS